MKKYRLILKTEMADKKMLLFTMFMMFMIISCILGFFGTIYGRQYQLFHNHDDIISGTLHSTDRSLLTTLNSFDSKVSYYFKSPIMDLSYQGYDLIGLSDSYDLSDLQGSYHKGSNDTIVIPYAFSIQQGITIGDQITLQNKTYTVTGTVGSSLGDNAFIISYDELINQSQDVSLEAVIKKGVSQSEYERIRSELSPYLKEGFYYSEFDKDTNGYLKQFRIYAIVLFLAAMINVVYIYSYTMHKRKNRYLAYRLVGATNRWIYTSVLIDTLGIFTICYVLAVFVTNAFYSYVLVPNIPNTIFLLSTKDCLLFYFSMLFLYTIMISMYLRKSMRSTITELKHSKEGF